MLGYRYRIRMVGGWAIALILSLAVGCSNRAAIEKAQSQVNRIAEELDRRTTETGVSVR